MTTQRRQIDYSMFFQLCEWIKRQPSPITLTRVDLVKAYHADTGIQVSTSAIKHALEATKVPVITRKGGGGSRADSNRTAKIVSIIRRLVANLEKDLGERLLSDEDKDYLFHIANGKPKATPAE